MSSIYSSEASSRRVSHSSLPSTSTSINQDLKFNSDDEEFNLDALFRKLDGYKNVMQEVEARLERQRSDTSQKEVDAAAAEHFRRELERLNRQKAIEDEINQHELPIRSDSLGKSTRPLRLDEWVSPALEYESASSDPSPNYTPELDFGFTAAEYSTGNLGKSLRRERPSPLLLTANHVQPLEVQSACLPPRTSSKRLPRSATSQEFPSRSHRRRVTTSEGRASSRNAIYISSLTELQLDFAIPPLPTRHPSSPGLDTISNHIPQSPMTMCFPDEDQLRRELEYFAVHDGAEPLDGLKYRRQRPPTLDLNTNDSDDDKEDWESEWFESPMLGSKPSPTIAISPAPDKYSHKPQKSLFSVFRKRSEVDDLLDLYFDDDQLDKSPVFLSQTTASTKKTRLMAGRNMFSRSKSVPKISPIQPQFVMRSPDLGQPI